MLEKTPSTDLGDAVHPFDRATRISRVEGKLQGVASADYFAFVGPFGGATAATLLRAIIEHPERAGDPLSVTVNFCAPVGSAPFELDARLLKATRSTQHWMVELVQDGGVAAFMTAVFAVRRPSWSHQTAAMPEAPPFDQIKPLPTSVIAPWAPQYGKASNDHPASAYSRMWLSDTRPRRIDFLSLLSMSDTFFARIFHVLGAIVPIGTVSMTTVFHADSADLAAENTTMVLGAADANIFHKSFSDQTGQLWSPGGRLLATTSQVVYFKA